MPFLQGEKQMRLASVNKPVIARRQSVQDERTDDVAIPLMKPPAEQDNGPPCLFIQAMCHTFIEIIRAEIGRRIAN